jgi:hypothetical protein
MQFAYLHIVIFTIWMLFIESKPWPTLTLAVSLEAIFLSTFVMIGQNRQAAFQQAKADHDFTEQELELKTSTQLTREIDRLTIELHNRLVGKPARYSLDGRLRPGTCTGSRGRPAGATSPGGDLRRASTCDLPQPASRRALPHPALSSSCAAWSGLPRRKRPGTSRRC